MAEKPLTVGSRIEFNAQFLGRQLAYVYEIIEFIPGHKLVMRTADGPFPMETTYTWETYDDNFTRMTLRNRGNPTGFSKIFTPFMSSLMRRANKKDLKKIKEILETKKVRDGNYYYISLSGSFFEEAHGIGVK